MEIISSKHALRELVRQHRSTGATIALVPTMGALHEGHASLIRAAAAECDLVVVSVFVNPTQFGPAEDFEQYPRTLDTDARLAAASGAHVVYGPAAGEVYASTASLASSQSGEPSDRSSLLRTIVSPGPIARRWEGAARPGHFDGVCTVVAKLLLSALPDRAYFGEKDYQQLVTIKQMVADLDIPVDIVGCPTVREPGGLALSSRNRYLSFEQRTAASAIYESLSLAREAFAAGEVRSSRLVTLASDHLAKRCGNSWEQTYLEVVDGDTLEPAEVADLDARIIVSGNLGGTHLIDNVRFGE